MLHGKHRNYILIIPLLLACLPETGYMQDTGTTHISDEEILAFLDNPDLLLQSAGETVPEEAPSPQSIHSRGLLLTSSFRAGIGHSDNFLKKYAELTASDYLQVEADIFAGWRILNLDLTAFALAEATLYDFELESSDETLLFAQLNGVLSKGYFDFGFEGSFLHGSFIYDSSLTAVSVPSGTQIRQVMPSLLLFANWYASGSNRIRLELGGSRAEFNLENQDYWDPEISLQLEHVWSKSFITSSELAYSMQLYDDEGGRTAGGEPINNGESLNVNRILFNQKLRWKPARWSWLQIDGDIGAAWENENVGSYEAMRQSWIRGRMTISNNWGQFRFSGKWGEYRYDNRLVSRFDPQLHLQTNRSLTIEYSRSLPWNLEVLLRRQWNGLKSRIYQDTYSERRTEILLQWSY